MNNDYPPPCKSSKWLVQNNKSSLPGLTMILACSCSVRHDCSYCVTPFPVFSATKQPGSLGNKGRHCHHSETITVQSREVGHMTVNSPQSWIWLGHAHIYSLQKFVVLSNLVVRSQVMETLSSESELHLLCVHLHINLIFYPPCIYILASCWIQSNLQRWLFIIRYLLMCIHWVRVRLG